MLKCTDPSPTAPFTCRHLSGQRTSELHTISIAVLKPHLSILIGF